MPRKFVRRSRRMRKSKRYNRVATRTFVKRILSKNQEFKYYDLNQTLTNTITWSNSQPLIVDLTQPAQGLTDLTRSGDKITFKNLLIRATITKPFEESNAFFKPMIFRVMVFQWYPLSVLGAATAPFVTTPSATQIIQSPGTWSIICPKKHDGSEVFSVLYDRRFILTESNGSPPTMSYDFRIKKKYIKKQISFDAGGIQGYNHIYIAFFTDYLLDADNNSVVSLYSRLTFTDS